jgi:hypothetical protein
MLSFGATGFFLEENMWHEELESTAAATAIGTRRFMGNRGRLGIAGYDREGNFLVSCFARRAVYFFFDE